MNVRRLVRISISVLLLCAALELVHGESIPPAEKCDFDGARVGAAVRRIAGSSPAPYYFACQVHNPNANETGCAKGSLPPGLVVTVDREQAGWSCVTGGDSSSGWMENSRLEELPTEPRPQMADWEGWWQVGKAAKGQKNDRLLITHGKEPGTLRVGGRAYWYGLYSVHFGQVNGEAIPIGNHLHILEMTASGEPSSCILDLTLIFDKGVPELQARDNYRCGGANVNFRGAWHRFMPHSAKRTTGR